MSKKSLPKHVRDNRANQLNPRHQEYYQCRGKDIDHVKVLAGQQSKVDSSVKETVTSSSDSKKPKE